MTPAVIHWPTLLDCTGKQKDVPRSTLANAVTVLQHDPLFQADVLWYDEFLDRVLTAQSPTREWRDDDDYRVTVYIQQTVGISTLADQLVTKAVHYVARQRSRHVVREWLDTLTWDGVSRIAHAFEDHWGVSCNADLSSDYVRAASTNFFIGLVARVRCPGCKLDTMPVFEGGQGIFKSSALEVLGGPWYADARETMGTKDFLVSLRGKWLVEISELHALSRAEVTAVKQTMSMRVDRYRPPYGRSAMDFPRQCAFAGTTNSDQWGTDETGLRRFWPIRCGVINLQTLRAARAQLFAEAQHRYRAGETWWAMPADTLTVQADRHYHDEWADVVATYLLGKSEAYVLDILQALKVPTERCDVTAQRRIGRLLRLAGWEKKKQRMGNTIRWRWSPLGDASDV